MLNVEGLVRITQIEEEDKYTKATVYFGIQTDKTNDDWENSFFNARLVGKANDKIAEVEEKEPIFITSGMVTNKAYQNKEGANRNWLQVTVFDFLYGEEMKEHMENLKKAHQKPKDKEEPKKRERRQQKKKINEITIIDDNDIPF